MAWTRKSSRPHCAAQRFRTPASTLAMSSTSQWQNQGTAELHSRQRLDPLAERLALIGEGQLRRSCAASALAMPQAIE